MWVFFQGGGVGVDPCYGDLQEAQHLTFGNRAIHTFLTGRARASRRDQNLQPKSLMYSYRGEAIPRMYSYRKV